MPYDECRRVAMWVEQIFTIGALKCNKHTYPSGTWISHAKNSCENLNAHSAAADDAAAAADAATVSR